MGANSTRWSLGEMIVLVIMLIEMMIAPAHNEKRVMAEEP